MAAMPPENLELIVHHVVLPPKLPQRAEDFQISRAAERDLIDLLSTELKIYRFKDDRNSSSIRSVWVSVEEMLNRCKLLISTYPLSAELLVRAFSTSDTSSETSILPIYLRAQNAVLVLRISKGAAIFECFEASPQTAAILAAKGALTRRFPAQAVSVSLKVFYDPKFQHELADKLSKLDVEEIQEMMPQSHKAGKKMGEIRDTTDPSLVTEMLMAILASVGEPVVCQQIQKRTRDDVLWDNCLSPWRRSALWLAIRVTLQITLTNALGSEEGISEYKNFMIFLITGIASQASAAELPDDLCHVIVAKVARRASKIGPKILNFVQDRALSVCRFVNSNQKSIWKSVCDKDGERPTTVDKSNVERDTSLTLHTSKQLLDTILVNDQGMHQEQSSFNPECHPWLGLHRELPSLDGLGSVKEENVYVLAEFESWISDCLLTWRQQRLAALDSEVCMELAGLTIKYRDAALQLYREAPEQVSKMILVIAELWQTLDMLASTQIPLLNEFAPGIAPNLFEPLLLSKQAQMQRLREVETHIAARQRQAKPNNPSIFSDPANNSFAVQFYASSMHHQALRARIESDATVEQARKEAEWKESSDTFERLKQDAKRRSCEKTHDIWGTTLGHDEYKCQKCVINRQAEAMTINVFEWPLPDQKSSCISAVVELDCPTELAAWRNLTWMLVHDLGRHAKVAGDSPAERLSTYAGLRSYARQKQSRLTLASATKAFEKAHYHVLKLPVTRDRCFARNALHYRLFDSVKLCWISDQVQDPDIHTHCITPLPEGPYSNLQYAVDSVTHSQNEVIADQESCSKDLSLHEFLSFGSLRADGERVQWQNIRRELMASNLSLNTEAVCTLLIQAMWQAGSSSDSSLRNSHLDLRDPSFCEELLANVAKVLASISANWKSDNVMFLLIVVVLRVLSLSPDTNVNTVALALLQKMRVVTEQWTENLGSILHNAVEPRQILRLQQRLPKAAILCKMTFDVDAQHVHRVMSTDDDVKAWTKSSMHVRDNLPGKEELLSIDLRRLLLRDRKVSHTLHRHVRLLVEKHKSKGLDRAIEQQWSDFQPQTISWSAFASPNQRWLHTRTASSADRRSQQVHYNILEGELLVDGSPLGRLPTDYIQSILYVRLFGAQVLHVFSSDMDGMLFMSAQKVNGYLVYFGKRGGNVVIRVRKESQILELVPQDSFVHDLPSAFVEGYFHWLNIASQEVELRPLDQAWQSSLENWRLLYQRASTSTLVRKDRRLIDIRSVTCAKIRSIFGGLETIENVHVTLSDSRCLEVALPRYDLRFFLNHDGDFECRELCKVVDPDQSVGTMIGLQSRLVLSGVQKLARKHDRILLIPEGDVASSRGGSHVEVSISVQGSRVRLFQYPIDATLRRLRGSGDMYGIIYMAYLHAITSHTLPDPLTARTGTEEALVYLRHGSLGFSKPPDQRMIDLLTRISCLTPHREYYPNHLKVMQRVKWDRTLSMIVQHDDFLPLAEQIMTSGNSYIMFYPESRPAESLYEGRDFDLLKRGMIRNSSFRSSHFGGDISARTYDSEYEARDCCADTARGQRSFEIASLVRDWPKKIKVSSDLERDLCDLGMVLGVGTKYDPSRSLSELLSVDFPSSWAPLQQTCRESSFMLDTYRLMFLFSVIAYGREVRSLTTLRTLLAFAFVSELRQIPVPSNYSYFKLSRGTELDEEALRREIMKNMSLYNGPGRKKHKAQWNAENTKHETKSKKQAEAVLQYYRGQWPSSDPATPPGTLSMSPHLNWSTASQEISTLFYVWTANGKYQDYLSQIQPILNEVCGEYCLPKYDSKDWHNSEKLLVTGQQDVIPSPADLMSAVSPAIFSKSDVVKIERDSKAIGKNDKLGKLIAAIRADQGGRDHHSIRTQYRKDLLASHDAFGEYKEQITPAQLPYTLTDTLIHRMTCESEVFEALKCIYDSLGAKSPASTLLELGGLWPRFTIRSLLATLSSRSSTPSSQPWRHCLLALGESITTLQRARRLVLAGERNDVPSFCAEIENEGHQGWNTNQWPDWLLIEIDGDFLIRPTQARVALEMIQPSSLKNSLVQLNMGEGKSSVIVPLVAVAIANGDRLSRVIVLKSLAKQMKDTIFQRLGGMVDRRVNFMPFSRKLQIDERVVSQIQHLNEFCLKSGGILLAQPEHILSFKLMGIERLTSGDFALASPLLQSQRWLESNTRDILDESDELLDVKFQLIYTLGTQRMMDGQPHRWLITQGIFDLIEKHASKLQKDYPSYIEVEYRTSSSFPTIRLLSEMISQVFINRIAHDVIDGQLPNLNLETCPPSVRSAGLRFIQNRQISDNECRELARYVGQRQSLIQKLLLLRGLLAFGILLFVIRTKRWSVTYGLHPTRCLSAVPYRAKGVPAPSAEFGHPDVAVALTCMSYYYAGLSNHQIRQAFELLQKFDDPSLEYSLWIKRCVDLPDHLCSWHAINLEDDQQCYGELFPALRYSKKMADFFMSNIVFPKEGKEFDEKLSTSGWDLVTKKGLHVTTGFSGTNDNRFLLPLSIFQRDLPELQHTSGKVLDYVLREENLRYHCARDDQGRQLSAAGLISYFHRLDSTIRVFIDVGAQVLDFTNYDFIKKWMEVACDVDAGIFFDEDDNVMVLTRDLKLEKLAVSSFQNRMDRCVVYLDEVHTRGTDLKLPANVRAAVTLGPNLTKDRLVQACMRLRKLAQGQSLLFLAPPEVHQGVTELAGKAEDQLDGYDVVAWSLEQSCQSIGRSQPLRILQGLNHSQRAATMDHFSKTYKDLGQLAKEGGHSSELVMAFREKEEQTLNDLYAPPSLKANPVPGLIEYSQNNPDPMVQDLLGMWGDLDSTTSKEASMHEEHEREVAHEVEQETQVERPPKVKAVRRIVDPKLRTFITTGCLENFVRFPVVYNLIVKKTSIILGGRRDPWAHLRATSDFARTVEQPQSGHYDNYLRPVNWVLTCKREIKPSYLLMISQYEANELMREIRAPSSGVNLHIYEPRVTNSMGSVDFGTELPSRSMREWQNLSSGLRRELNLFAGQVYLNTYKDYMKLCKDLGPKLSPSIDETLSFVQAWIAIRRKGQDFLQTHVGQMVSGRSIKEHAFE